MSALPHDKVLRERYQLVQQLPMTSKTSPSEAWIALDDDENEYLVKLWPFGKDGASNLQRALWDTELRMMYRVSSSPGAENSLMVIRDAGLDHEQNRFVMILQALGGAPGYDTLSEALLQRRKYPWLVTQDIDVRRKLWIALRQIAHGIQLLHDQSVLHRNINPENVFFHPDSGPASFRLGGFEWSVRVGELHIDAPPDGWSLPPEFTIGSATGYQPETDWYGFGMLAVRCLLNVEPYRAREPKERYQKVLDEINQANERALSDIERVILQRLLARQRNDRLTRGSEIIAALEDLIDSLRNMQARRTEESLVLVYSHNNAPSLIEAALEAGYIPDPEHPQHAYNPNDIIHTTRLSTFIQEDLIEGQLYRVDDDYFLVGRQMSMKVGRFNRRDPHTGQNNLTWDALHCIHIAGLQGRRDNTAHRDLPKRSIVARTLREIRNDTILAQAQSWERYLPQLDSAAKLRASLSQFHDFIRCTNQIELLMRDTELFRYTIVSRTRDADKEVLELRENLDRGRPVMESLRLEGGLVGFLLRERESGNDNSHLVVLSSEDSLRFPRAVRIEPSDAYTVSDIRVAEEVVVVERSILGERSEPAPDQGWLRVFGLFGQMELIRRRTDAIEQLTKHSYLLRSLAATGETYIDTGQGELPIKLPTDQIDASKQAVMEDVLRTRPIYALQGPPGTGKTTMVAHLLRQIFDADPVAQVLITAQAHGAVEVLRAKVRDEAFAGIAEPPLAIRLGRRQPSDASKWEGSLESEAVRLLEGVVQAINREVAVSDIQKQWRAAAQEMCDAIKSNQTTRTGQEFLELVKRGASITYCTTSAGDLEELARGTQSYDWTIIEEAGKCHGFDLALPLQAGHRWVLIGDQAQLPPYRLKDYQKALGNLDQVVDHLKQLPKRAAGLLDSEWIERWDGLSEQQRLDFKTFALDRLRTFSYIFGTCAYAPRGVLGSLMTADIQAGAIAGRLSYQYRMHPAIGTLISQTYYGGTLRNCTEEEDGSPKHWVVLPVAAPEAIRHAGIVWIDTPWAVRDPRAGEQGPAQGLPRYTNPYEIEVIKGFLAHLRLDPASFNDHRTFKLAVLSPYMQQVQRLNKTRIELPPGIKPKPALNIHLGQESPTSRRLAHTVDSFQGNEADLVIVSLVRNNSGRHEQSTALGFLVEPERINVLLSRAQRMLVLVGSWEFFSEQVKPFPLSDDSRQEWHLKQAITLLGEWFETGKAVKLNASELIGGRL